MIQKNCAILILGLTATVMLTTAGIAENMFCTQEAKICPDGSAVGRTGPHCEFAPCPDPPLQRAEPTPAGQNSGIVGKVLLGPRCPVIRPDREEECVDQPYRATFVVVTRDAMREVARFDSSADGTFKVIVPPGDYSIVPTPGSPPYPHCGHFVKVEPNTFTEVIVRCDTGIR